MTDINLKIRPLQPEEWPMIAEKYKAVFNNGMPTNPAQCIFFGIFLKDELIGFTHLETVFSLNASFVDEEHRSTRLLQTVYKFMDAQIPAGFAVIIFPEKRWSRLLRFFGFIDRGPVTLWRKDYQ